jgi:hypothetical protein
VVGFFDAESMDGSLPPARVKDAGRPPGTSRHASLARTPIRPEPPMTTPYNVIEKVQNETARKDYLAVFELLNTDPGMKICRDLLRVLNLQVATAADLAKELVAAETGMAFTGYVYIRGDYAIHPQKFLSFLTGKKGLIDQAAGDVHGWHTHRLQWWLVYTAWEKKKVMLTNPPGDLYKMLGLEKASAMWGSRPKYVWDDQFDHDPDAAGLLGRKKYTFGRPEYFCPWLKGKVKAKPDNSNKVNPDNNNDKSKSKEAKAQAYQNLALAFSDLEGTTGGVQYVEV